MTIPFKPRVAKTICRIDRKTQAVTANVAFEDIDLTIDGEGSEVYDYDIILVLHATSAGGFLFAYPNDLNSFQVGSMSGITSTASASVVSSSSYAFFLQANQSDYPSIYRGKLTGYVGNKRSLDGMTGYSGNTPRVIEKNSAYTNDTSSEIVNLVLKNSASSTITYSLIITAVPKLQYNPHAILLKHKTLTNQTADIIFGGANDTEGVDDLDGDVYDYYLNSNLIDGTSCGVFINETNRSAITQYIYNASGTIGSYNESTTRSGVLRQSGDCYVVGDIGRKKLSVTSVNGTLSIYAQYSQVYWDSDTSAKLTSLKVSRLEGTLSGDIWLYAVPKGYNADLTPWTHRESIDINGDFSAGHSFEIPDWAMFMKVDLNGNMGGGIRLRPNNISSSSYFYQRLFSRESTTGASATSNTEMLLNVSGNVSHDSFIMALKTGSNRPSLLHDSSGQDAIYMYSQYLLDSSSPLTSVNIYGTSTDTTTAKLTVSFI